MENLIAQLLEALIEARDDWLTAFDSDVNEGDPDAVALLKKMDEAIERGMKAA